MTGPITLRLTMRERRTILTAINIAKLAEQEWQRAHHDRGPVVARSRRVVAYMERLAARVRNDS
jgi:hypothetical protein